MKRIVVEIDDKEPSLDSDGVISITAQDYFEFLREMKADLWDYFLKSIKLSCSNCNSFVMKTEDFVQVFSEFDYGSHELREYVDIDEDKLLKHLNGEQRIDGLLEDEDGNCYRYVSDEVAFIFNKNCDCYDVLVKE